MATSNMIGGGGGGGGAGSGVVAIAGVTAMNPLHQQAVMKLVPDLKSKSEEVRYRAAKALIDLVSSDLREVSPEELSAVLDLITKQMLDSSGKADVAANSGGILTIVVLINALDLMDVCKTDSRITR